MEMGPHDVISISWCTGNGGTHQEQRASQAFQDKGADLWVVMYSDLSERYSDVMERFYKAFAVTFDLRFSFPLISIMLRYQ